MLGVCSFAALGEEGSACCTGSETDLDARIEALGAVSRGKGASLKISGQVNRVLMNWDDGAESDSYIADNIYSSSRATFSGEAQAAPWLRAGFAIEAEIREVGTSTLTAENDEGSAVENGDGLRLRLAYGWVESEQLGRLSVGHLSPGTNSLSYYQLWTVIVHTSPDVLFNTSFDVRDRSGGASGLRWSDLASGLDSPRGDFVQWMSPQAGGFRLWADAGENDVLDAALTFDGATGPFTLSAAAGVWRDDETVNATDLRFSGLLRHEPSGFYLHGAYVQRDFDDPMRETARFAWVHAGLRHRFLEGTLTTFFVEAGRYSDIRAGAGIAAPEPLAAEPAFIAASETNRVGAGVMHSFTDAVELYAIFQNYEAEVEIAAQDGARTSVDLLPWQAVIVGSRLRF